MSRRQENLPTFLVPENITKELKLQSSNSQSNLIPKKATLGFCSACHASELPWVLQGDLTSQILPGFSWDAWSGWTVTELKPHSSLHALLEAGWKPTAPTATAVQRDQQEAPQRGGTTMGPQEAAGGTTGRRAGRRIQSGRV